MHKKEKILFKDDSASPKSLELWVLQERFNSEISKYSLHVNEKNEFIITISSADWMITVTSHRLVCFLTIQACSGMKFSFYEGTYKEIAISSKGFLLWFYSFLS